VVCLGTSVPLGTGDARLEPYAIFYKLLPLPDTGTPLCDFVACGIAFVACCLLFVPVALVDLDLYIGLPCGCPLLCCSGSVLGF
jgi:hypothetical protein